MATRVESKLDQTTTLSQPAQDSLPIDDRPNTCWSRAAYWLTRPFALMLCYKLRFPCLLRCVGLQNSPGHCRELMRDIGGESFSVPLKDGSVIDGMYFDPQKFQESQNGAYKKWSARFTQATYQKTTSILEIDLDGKNLRDLLGLPDTIVKIESDDIQGVIWCQGAGNIFEFNPQDAVMHLLRGKHVVMFNYSGIMQSKGTPGWRQTCLDTQAVTEWLIHKLQCKPEQIALFGKSMGSGTASWAAAKIPGVNLVIDRGLTGMTPIAETRTSRCKSLAVYATTKFYRYPTLHNLQHVQGRVLIMEAVHDALIPSSHPAELFKALVASKLKTTDPEKIEAFAKKFWIKAAGGHSSGDNGEFSWYRDPATQKQLNAFFIKS